MFIDGPCQVTNASDQDLLESARSVLDIEIAALVNVKESLGSEFLSAVEMILHTQPSDRVIVMGMGKSGHVGKKIAATLASTGTPAFFVHPSEAGHGDLGMITSKDIVIAISQSGKSEEILRVIPYLKRNAISLIVMTGVANSPLALHADIVISTAVEREACPLGLAPTSSTTLTMALGDALAICLLKCRGFTAEDFAATHPHGALGRRLLLTIGDIMVSGELIPIVSPNTTIRKTLVEMSRGGLGFVIVVEPDNVICGIFTDGDLRRTLDNEVDIKTTLIEKVMNTHFVSAKPKQLAVEAVELMEEFKMSALPIVNDKNHLVGALNIRILLQSGVI